MNSQNSPHNSKKGHHLSKIISLLKSYLSNTKSLVLTHKWILISILILFILFQYSLKSQAEPDFTSGNNAPLTLQNGNDRYSLGKFLEFAPDPDAAFDSKESPEKPAINLVFTPSTKDVPALGYTKNVQWARLSLSNKSIQTEWYLAVAPAYLDHIDLYVPQEGAWKISHAGRSYPFSQREVPDRNFVFSLSIPSNADTTVYLRFATESTLLVNANLYQPQGLYQERYDSQLYNGILYGILAFALGYNFFLFVSLKDFSYLYFTIFTAAIAIFGLVIDGYGMQYLWQDAVWLNRILIPASLFLAVGTSARFTIEFLQTRLTLPKMHWWLVILSVYSFSMMVISPFIPYRLAAMAANNTNIIAVTSYLLVGAIALQKKSTLHVYFCWHGEVCLSSL